jgi:hypothetical protein
MGSPPVQTPITGSTLLICGSLLIDRIGVPRPIERIKPRLTLRTQAIQREVIPIRFRSTQVKVIWFNVPSICGAQIGLHSNSIEALSQ